MLHLLSIPALQQELLERIDGEDDVILRQAATLNALTGHAGNGPLSRLLARQCRVYVLREMLAVYGIEASRVMSGVDIIDYAGFVDLTIVNSVIHSWS